MLTFKKFLEADGAMPDQSELGGTQAPTTPNQAPQQGQQQQGKQLKGTLTDNEKRVLALLSSNNIKSAPGLARNIISGDRNMVQAVKGLKLNFKAVDVTPDGVMINQTGTALAGNQGVVDPNSGELTPYGQKLASTLPSGADNPKTKDAIGGAAPGGMPGQGAPMPAAQPLGGFGG